MLTLQNNNRSQITIYFIVWFVWLVFISTYTHSAISWFPLFSSSHFRASHLIHLRHNSFRPSLTSFAQLTLLDLPKNNLDTEPFYGIATICEYTALRAIQQLNRIAFWILNVFSRQLYNLTLQKITCNWCSRSTTGHTSLTLLRTTCN